MKQGLISSFCVLLFLPLFSQEYSRVRIDLKGSSIEEMRKLGIDTDHGIHVPFRSFESDLHKDEIQRLKEGKVKYSILIDDVQSYYQDETRPSEVDQLQIRSQHCDVQQCNNFTNYTTPQNYSYGSMGGFHTLNEMNAVLDQMHTKFPQLITKRAPISSLVTKEGRSVEFVKIGKAATGVQKPEILYTALHHAREPVSLSQMIFFMWYLLENYEKDAEIRNLVDKIDAYFIPCINPDGYVYNEFTNPKGGGLWRKNVYYDNGNLIGVDLNRNYGYEWGKDNLGSSFNPLSATYRGNKPFSEPETQAVAEFVSKHNFLSNLNYHSFSNVLIHPEVEAGELARFQSVGNELSEENCFIHGTSNSTLGYGVNGDSDSWLYFEKGEKNSVFSFTPEVGTSFWPPKQDIDFLNKSTIPMNLKAMKMARNYSTVEIIETNPTASSRNNTVLVIVKKLGFGSNPVRVSIKQDERFTNRAVTTKDLHLAPGQADTIEISYDLISQPVDGDIIRNEFHIYYDEFHEVEVRETPYFKNTQIAVISDGFESSSYTFDGGWDITNFLGFFSKHSLTDSHGGQYKPNEVKITNLKQPIDLTRVHEASLSFAARWSIETDFDYMQVLASTDGVNFTPLCGEYTRIGKAGEPVYDGFQQVWVNETISLNDYLGKEKVYIRFQLTSDDYFESDGFYVDDFRVNVVRVAEQTTSTNEMELEDVRLHPNPVSDILTVELNEIFDFKVSNTLGQIVNHGTADGKIDVSNLSDGVYYVKIRTTKGQKTIPFYKIH